MFTAGYFGELCDAVYLQWLACHSSHRAEALSHSTLGADSRGSVFALGNSGGDSSEAAAATLGSLSSRPWRNGGDEVSCSQCDVVAWNRRTHWGTRQGMYFLQGSEECTQPATIAPVVVAWISMAASPHELCWSFRGKMFILLMNAHSKWPEILEMTSTMANKTPLQPSDVCSLHLAYQNKWWKTTVPRLCHANLLISWRAMEWSTSTLPLIIHHPTRLWRGWAKPSSKPWKWVSAVGYSCNTSCKAFWCRTAVCLMPRPDNLQHCCSWGI